MDYEYRVDFRAFDVLVEAIDAAPRDKIKGAYDTAREIAKDSSYSRSKREIWAEFARMLKKQLAKF